jgi:hypothetical protein
MYEMERRPRNVLISMSSVVYDAMRTRPRVRPDGEEETGTSLLSIFPSRLVDMAIKFSVSYRLIGLGHGFYVDEATVKTTKCEVVVAGL